MPAKVQTQTNAHAEVHTPAARAGQPLPAPETPSCRTLGGSKGPARASPKLASCAQGWLGQQKPPQAPQFAPTKPIGRSVYIHCRRQRSPRGVCESRGSSDQHSCPGHPQPMGLPNPCCNFLLPKSLSSSSPGGRGCMRASRNRRGSTTTSSTPGLAPTLPRGSTTGPSPAASPSHSLTPRSHLRPGLSPDPVEKRGEGRSTPLPWETGIPRSSPVRRAPHLAPSTVPSVSSSHRGACPGETCPSAAASSHRRNRGANHLPLCACP